MHPEVIRNVSKEYFISWEHSVFLDEFSRLKHQMP